MSVEIDNIDGHGLLQAAERRLEQIEERLDEVVQLKLPVPPPRLYRTLTREDTPLSHKVAETDNWRFIAAVFWNRAVDNLRTYGYGLALSIEKEIAEVGTSGDAVLDLVLSHTEGLTEIEESRVLKREIAQYRLLVLGEVRRRLALMGHVTTLSAAEIAKVRPMMDVRRARVIIEVHKSWINRRLSDSIESRNKLLERIEDAIPFSLDTAIESLKPDIYRPKYLVLKNPDNRRGRLPHAAEVKELEWFIDTIEKHLNEARETLFDLEEMGRFTEDSIESEE